MKTLYEAANAIEAHMLADLLEQQGITAHIHGEALQGAIGELPAAGLVRLVVDDEDYASARAAIERWERQQADETPRPQSQARGSRALPAFVLGVLVGATALYAAYRTPVTTEGIDYDRDGVLDEQYTYSPNGTLLKMEADRNLDHKVDYIAHYDRHGVIAWAEADDDFNGTFETRLTFRDGNVQTMEVDNDGDGLPDVRTRYDNGVPQTVEQLDPHSGLPLRIEHYKLGKLLYVDVDTDRDGRLDTRLTYSATGEVASRTPLSQ
jgi:hypothetical protein